MIALVPKKYLDPYIRTSPWMDIIDQRWGAHILQGLEVLRGCYIYYAVPVVVILLCNCYSICFIIG